MTIRDEQFHQGLPVDPLLNTVAERVLTAYLAQYPFVATDLGLHDFDGELPDITADSLNRFWDVLRSARDQLGGVEEGALSRSDWADYQTLRYNVESLWLDANRDHPERHDPNVFNGVISESLLSLVRGNFGTIESRARNTLSRLRQVPAYLFAALEQLDNPPRLFVEMAIEQFTQTVPFLQKEVPAAFQQAPGAVRLDIARAGEEAARAYLSFAAELKNRVLPKSHGDYRLGGTRYQEKLFWQEGIDVPLLDLLARGQDELDRLHERLAQLVSQKFAGRSVTEVVDDIRKDHWSAHEILPETAQLLSDLRAFVLEKDLLSMPESTNPEVVETPAFMRMTTLASIVPPGPFEKANSQAHYQVTLPDPQQTAEQQEAQLRTLNKAAMRIISGHEVYPGHFAQFLHIPRTRSTVRRIFWSGAFVEGWAHYSEELMVEQGYGAYDPSVAISQILEALERVGRYIVGIQIHRGEMTLKEAQQFFMQQCHLNEVGAHRESLRGTQDPFYLIYTLGKLEILDMRREAQKREGAAFSLRGFHDALLSHGMPAMPVLRELMREPQK